MHISLLPVPPVIIGPFVCPVCGSHGIEQVLDEYRLTATKKGSENVIIAFVAFQCVLNGHVFLVRPVDAQSETGGQHADGGAESGDVTGSSARCLCLFLWVWCSAAAT